MDESDISADWSLVQSFLAVAETGSLSAAARQLGRSQPTLGRQIQTFEKRLNAQLFERHARGLKLSSTGQDLLPMARDMRVAMETMSLTAAGQVQAIEGTVRITASVFASHYVLPPILAHIRSQEPSISIVLVPSDTAENLLFREADIAVRMYRPTQMDIVTRHITSIDMGIFAAHSYLAQAGRPSTVDALLDHDLVGFETNDLIVRTMRGLGWAIGHEDFAVRTDNQSAYWELVRAGCGIGFTQRAVGIVDPLVEELKFDVEIPPLDVWLAAHQAMRQTPRIRRVWDMLAEGLHYSQLNLQC